MAFYVIGGVYENTKFERIVEGAEEHGPFPTYDEAKVIWQARSWAKVDDCHARFSIVERQ